MFHHLGKAKVAAVWGGIALVGAVAGGLGFRSEQARLTRDLMDDARRCAVVFDGADLRRLAGARTDLESPVYAAMKRRLTNLQAVNPRVRFVYIFRSRPETSKVIYLGDSAQAGAKDESLPGDDYPQAGDAPGLQEILRTGMPTTEGPLRDEFGVWITGYAAIDEGPAAPAGAGGRHIVGIDIEAADWKRWLWGAAFERAFYLWVLLGVPFGALLVLRRQLEQREAIRNLSEAMEQSHSALLVVDLDGCIEYANRGVCRQMGYTRRELIGRPWRDFQVAETAPEMLAELVATVRSGLPWEGDWFNRRKDGTNYPVRGVVTPVKRRDRSLSCFVAVFDDMTEIRRKESELREARDSAQAGDRAKGQFLATMSHEVRTPLNGIVGFTNLLLDTPLNAEQRDYVQTVRMSGEALIQLTGDILDFARIETGKLALEPAACDPRDCVEEVLDLFAAAAGSKHIALLHWVDDAVPAAVVADSGRLRQVLINLVNNAVKFTEQGMVEVTVVVVPPEGSAEPGGAGAPPAGETARVGLRFAVRDTGIGIAAEHYGKLFKPFTQVDASTTRKFAGTGLGLAICRNLVGLMGGEVSFTSKRGVGSVFSFVVWLPVSLPAKPAPHLVGQRLAVVAPPGALRRELVRLAQRWQVQPTEADEAAGLRAGVWDTARVVVDEAAARALVAPGAPPPVLPPARTFGLVPLVLSSELRHALRAHFRLLVNTPVHHDALGVLLGGPSGAPALPNGAPACFELRVLLVEDNPVNQRLMQKVLTNLGCTWTLADNGRRAVDELIRSEGRYEVVLMDLHLPAMDGIAALGAIRAGGAGPQAQTVWVAVLTADVREDQRERAFAAGANDYLIKPLKPHALEAALQRFRAARPVRN